MFGNLGQLMNIMKNAGAIKQGMAEMTQRMEAARYEGAAGGGQVQAVVNGKGDLVSLKIDPAVVQAGDVELLEDLTCAAVRDAVQRSRAAVQQEMQQAFGGLSLPGMGDLLGGGLP